MGTKKAADTSIRSHVCTPYWSDGRRSSILVRAAEVLMGLLVLRIEKGEGNREYKRGSFFLRSILQVSNLNYVSVKSSPYTSTIITYLANQFQHEALIPLPSVIHHCGHSSQRLHNQRKLPQSQKRQNQLQT